jgi:hypothetical protein
MNAETSGAPNLVRRAIGSPWVGLIGALAGVLALLASAYFYSAAQRYRQLAFYVQPDQLKTVLVRAGQLSDLHILYRTEELSTDVTAVQLAIWNQGNESIRPANVIQPIRIVTEPHRRILKASVAKMFRDIIGFRLDESKLSDGIVGVDWKILERGDGALVQLVYAGGPSVTVSLEGVIEGQPRIAAVHYSGKISSASEQIAEQGRSGLNVLAASAPGFVMGIFLLLSEVRRPSGTNKSLRLGVATGMFIVFLGASAYSLFVYLRTPAPPFGF